MSREPITIYGALPEGRRIEGPDTPDDYVGTVRGLPHAERSVLKLLRQRIRELDSRKLRQDGKVWTDRKTGDQFTLVKSIVNPIEPRDSDVTAFVVRDHCILYLRPLGTKEKIESVTIGELYA